MCLDTITKRYDPPDPTVRKAYKAFDSFPEDAGKLRQLFYSIAGTYYLDSPEDIYTKHGEWLTASEGIVKGWGDYPCGFHAFETREEAQNYWQGGVILEVSLRGVHTEGRHWRGSKILVAREMFVPKPEEKQ